MISYRRNYIEQIDFLTIGLFFLSWLNSYIVLVFYISLIALLKYRTTGAIKGLILLTTRGLLSSAIAERAGSYDMAKLALIMVFSLFILLIDKDIYGDGYKARNIVIAIILFSLYAAISSFITGSYPIVSLFKVVSFSIPMCAIMIGTARTSKTYDWMDYFTILYTLLMIISFALIPLRQFRIVNKDFQGVFNHVNVLGVICALYIASVLRSRFFSSHAIMRNIMIIAAIIMAYLSKSRTGMFSIVAILALFFILNNYTSLANRIIIAIGALIAIVLIYQFVDEETVSDISNIANSFIYKGDTTSIWAHRTGLLEDSRVKFAENPLLGSGFMVPYYPGYTNYSFTFSLVIEPGNLIWAVLGDTGIIGAAFFLILLIIILRSGTSENWYLYVGAVMINMGETVFFSANNMSILIYLLLGSYAFSNHNEVNENGSELYYSCL